MPDTVRAVNTAINRPICDHGSYYMNEDGAQVCLVCGHVTNRPIRTPKEDS